MINYIFNQLEDIRRLQEKIKSTANDIENKLRDELGIESVVYTDRTPFEVQLFSYEDVELVAKEKPKFIDKDDEDYPYEAYNIVDDITFFTILTESEYKKATATTAADES